MPSGREIGSRIAKSHLDPKTGNKSQLSVIEDTCATVVGFTWYSLTDQMDWDTALREDNGNVNPLGLYDLNRQIRPVGEAYKELIAGWRQVLPTQSVCLQLPIVPPSQHEETYALRQRAAARQASTAAKPSTEPSTGDGGR